MFRNKYLALLVAVLFVVVLIYNIAFFSKRLRPHASHTTLPTPVTKIDNATKKDKSPFPVEKDKSRWRRDPFMHRDIEFKDKKPPHTFKGKSNVKIVLQGIMKTKGESYALVNGWIIKKGDKIEGMLVEDILNDSILLRDGPVQKEIKLD